MGSLCDHDQKASTRYSDVKITEEDESNKQRNSDNQDTYHANPKSYDYSIRTISEEDLGQSHYSKQPSLYIQIF